MILFFRHEQMITLLKNVQRYEMYYLPAFAQADSCSGS